MNITLMRFGLMTTDCLLKESAPKRRNEAVRESSSSPRIKMGFGSGAGTSFSASTFQTINDDVLESRQQKTFSLPPRRIETGRVATRGRTPDDLPPVPRRVRGSQIRRATGRAALGRSGALAGPGVAVGRVGGNARRGRGDPKKAAAGKNAIENRAGVRGDVGARVRSLLVLPARAAPRLGRHADRRRSQNRLEDRRGGREIESRRMAGHRRFVARRNPRRRNRPGSGRSRLARSNGRGEVR